MSSFSGTSGVKVILDPAQICAFVYAWGTPSPRDYIKATEEMLTDNNWQAGMNVLVDYRTLSGLGFRTEGIRSISGSFENHAVQMGDGKCAVITPNVFVHALFRMWQPWLPTKLLWDTRPFRDPDEACQWLGVNMRDMPTP